MMQTVRTIWALLLCIACIGSVFFLVTSTDLFARNIIEYRDLLTDSAPSSASNHTVSFTITTDVSPGGYIEMTPPAGFTILSTSTFAERNVELYVNGVPRVATTTADAVNDGVSITTGSPGLIRYTLNSSTGLTSGDELSLRVGNHTTNALQYSENYSTTTGTTTIAADVEPITNSAVLGRHDVAIKIYDGGLVADADAVVFVVERVSAGPADTTEEIPPYRFNGAPTSTVGGTTLSVEISLETDEFAICKFSTVASTTFAAMPNTFSNTGFIFHSTVVGVTPNSIQRFYVRCIDDEDNFNTDDYLIIFSVTDTPSGTANEEGDVSGDGTGSGNAGGGTGNGSGGQQGSADGNTPAIGGTTGGGGSGGGGGGRSGSENTDATGGGLNNGDAPYESGDGEVVVSGYAFPGSTVVILVDGNIALSTTAGNNGSYSATVSEIARGVYTFGVYGIDRNNVKSSTFSTSFTVTGSRTTSLSNVNVMPSILVTPDPVDVGEPLTLSGYSIPNADITIENMKDKVSQSLRTFTTTSGSNGAWSLEVDTAGFSEGTYKVRASAKQTGGVSTSFSNYTYYGVGQNADVPLNADLNRDGNVNLIDFSILLFWWGGDGGDSDPPADINRDDRVNLTDFSILLFNWTG